MNKLSLSVEDLEVESFATSAGAPEPSGTVHGHDATRGGCNTRPQISCLDPCLPSNDTCV